MEHGISSKVYKGTVVERNNDLIIKDTYKNLIYKQNNKDDIWEKLS